MYRLTNDADCILRLDEMALIPRGHRMWPDYEVWLDAGNVPEPAHTPDERALFKARRAEAVRTITVTTSAGRVFDGDEISQGRIARAIIGLEGRGEEATLRWILHDNSVFEVGVEELREVLVAAGQAQADLWVPD